MSLLTSCVHYWWCHCNHWEYWHGHCLAQPGLSLAIVQCSAHFLLPSNGYLLLGSVVKNHFNDGVLSSLIYNLPHINDVNERNIKYYCVHHHQKMLHTNLHLNGCHDCVIMMYATKSAPASSWETWPWKIELVGSTTRRPRGGSRSRSLAGSVTWEMSVLI